MDAKHDPSSTVHEPPGQDDGGDPAAAASTTAAAGSSSLPAEALAALPGLIGRWRHRWCVRYADGMYTAQRRDFDHETGDVTYLDVFIVASTPEALDAEITAWEAENGH